LNFAPENFQILEVFRSDHIYFKMAENK